LRIVSLELVDKNIYFKVITIEVSQSDHFGAESNKQLLNDYDSHINYVHKTLSDV
jgi:hypothetical protein